MTLDGLIDRLHAEGRLRVWSLAVTVFGDAVAPRGGSIAMADLSAVLERLGAEPGAIRTAMSRLARDGYVERAREGRRSFYSLAPRAAAAFAAAAERIYAAEPPGWDGRWTVALGPEPEDADALSGLIRIAPGAWVAAGDAEAPPGMFAIRGGRGEAPDWARDLLSPPDLAARYAAFAAAWAAFDPASLTGVEAMAARALLIHDWRRILLRDAPLPRALRPADWPGAAARDLVADRYRALAPASEAWLDRCRVEDDAPLPPPGGAFRARFGGGALAAAE